MTGRQRKSAPAAGRCGRPAARRAPPPVAVPAGPTPPAKRRSIPRGFDLDVARRYLARADPALGRWMRRVGPLELSWRAPFEPVDALARSILYQQLAGKAAATIVGRVEKLLPRGPHLHAEDLRDAAHESLRACGVSANKQRALKDLADKALAGVVPRAQELRWLGDDELIERFSAVRGIGRWTVEMMLIGRLGRPDVLPIDDLGIRKGAQLVWSLPEMPKPKALAELGQRWAPYRTLASLYLWRVVELDRARRK